MYVWKQPTLITSLKTMRERSEVLSQYVQKKWNRKIDWVSVSNEIATDYGISCNFGEIGLDIATDLVISCNN